MPLSLLAQTTNLPPVYRFAPLLELAQWWQWMTLVAVLVALGAWVTFLYVRDTHDLPRGTAVALGGLRLIAFGSALLFFLNLERRIEQQVTRPSRAVMLVDTSLSMGLRDITDQADGPSRLEAVTAALSTSDLLPRLRSDHDVLVYRFDEANRPTEVGLLERQLPPEQSAQAAQAAFDEGQLRLARQLLTLAGLLGVVVTMAAITWIVLRVRRQRAAAAWAMTVGVLTLFGGMILVASAHLAVPDWPVAERLGFDRLGLDRLGWAGLGRSEGASRRGSGSETNDSEDASDVASRIDWSTALVPQGLKTRIGDAIRTIIAQEQGGPIAGVILITDGGQNDGLDPDAGIAAAREAEIPIHVVGIGRAVRPVDVMVEDLQVPERAYPEDEFVIRGVVRGFGVTGQTVRVRLTSQDASLPASATSTEDERTLTLGPDGAEQVVRFQMQAKPQGRYLYTLRVEPPPGDTVEANNARSATMEIVEQKTKVLIFAGGPTREFQFLRNLLFRDKQTQLEVFLQSGQPGMSQEADELLFEFPPTREKLFAYDAIVAFDPDWTTLSPEQVRWVEEWVAEQAGGLIVVAGPVFTPKWTRDSRDGPMRTIADLYPVSFFARGAATVRVGRFGGVQSWPIQFTRDGEQFPALWLSDTPAESRDRWGSFEGVFGYYAVKDPKRGATILARFSDPETAIEGDLPIYLASHFYGAGRVLFQASGEMWRLRAVEERNFTTYYTKLIRWVSQGRLLRDSQRGVLLVDKQQGLIGDRVSVSAMLVDRQRRPLDAEEVLAVLVSPDGKRTPFPMRRVEGSARDGMFGAEFTALLEGTYRVELIPPGGGTADALAQDIRARVPDLERERPLRNDPLLSAIATRTGGSYRIGFEGTASAAVVDRASATQEGATASETLRPIPDLLTRRDQQTFLPGLPDGAFEEVYAAWLLVILAGSLCVEWIIRRLHKLA